MNKTGSSPEEELVLYTDRLLAYIRRRVEDRNEAEDICQETVMSATVGWPNFRNESAIFTWLCGIANHEIADFYRKKKIKAFLFSHFPWLEELASEALGPEQEYLKSEVRQKVLASLRSLDEGYSEVLRLRYLQGKSVFEIAKELNASYKAIESRLSRARRAFAEVYSLNGS